MSILGVLSPASLCLIILVVGPCILKLWVTSPYKTSSYLCYFLSILVVLSISGVFSPTSLCLIILVDNAAMNIAECCFINSCVAYGVCNTSI